jgi:cytochrome c553
MSGANPATGAYVCNYPGPGFYSAIQGLSAKNSSWVNQPAIDSVILNATSSLNEIACVAMDYGIIYPGNATAGLNNGTPFVRFLVFNAAGKLIPTVNLDGLHPTSQIPNACTSCHGGANSAPYTGANFLPFDEANFAFLSMAGKTQADQEAQFKQLNKIVLNAKSTTPSISPIYDLIHGWYDDTTGGAPDCIANPNDTRCLALSVQNTSFVPPLLVGTGDEAVYKRIWAPMCRTCHAAGGGGVGPFEPTQPGEMLNYFAFGTAVNVCDSTRGIFVMPNSKITFDRFWTTHVNANRNLYPASPQPIDLPGLLSSYFSANGNGGCSSFQFAQ